MLLDLLILVAGKFQKIRFGCGKRLPPEGMFTSFCGADRGRKLCPDCRRKPINAKWLKRSLRLWWRKKIAYGLNKRIGPYMAVVVESEHSVVHTTVPRWPSWLINLKDLPRRWQYKFRKIMKIIRS